MEAPLNRHTIQRRGARLSERKQGKAGEQLLTPRQLEILRLVSEGLTNREIADHLEISVRTTEVHRFNLMRRLKVRNVAQLLRQALILRLLPAHYSRV
jgi:DNA-binding NarL/FixJ family response regulator